MSISERQARQLKEMGEGEYKERIVTFWRKIGEFVKYVRQPQQSIPSERQNSYIVESLTTAAELDWSANLSDLAATTLPSKDYADLWERVRSFLEKATAAGWPDEKIVQQIELMTKEAETGQQQRGFDSLALNSLPVIPE